MSHVIEPSGSNKDNPVACIFIHWSRHAALTSDTVAASVFVGPETGTGGIGSTTRTVIRPLVMSTLNPTNENVEYR